MRRRHALAKIALVGAAPFVNSARAQSRLPLIAVLLHGAEGAFPGRMEAFVEGLRDLGYVEGRHYIMEVRWTDNDVGRLPVLARELLAKSPAVAVCSPTITAQAFHRESKTIPIVMAMGSGAARLGLIASLARPGGNVTGVQNLLDELAVKQIEFVNEIVPRAKRVMTLSSGFGASEPDVRRGSQVAAKAYGMTLIEVLADTPAKLQQVSALCQREGCDALVVLIDPNVLSFRSEIIAMAAKLRIPGFYPFLEFVEDGGMFAYSIEARSLFRRTASYVDRILKGAKPADLPVEQPTSFEIHVNVKAAKSLDISIPQSILLRADRVIEG